MTSSASGATLFYQKSADGVIDVVSDDTLAYRDGMFDAVALADVFGHETLLAGVIPDRHPAPADPTDHQALQQRWTLTGRTLAVGSDRLSVLPQAQQVLFVPLPGDVAGVSILEYVPRTAPPLPPGTQRASNGNAAYLAWRSVRRKERGAKLRLGNGDILPPQVLGQTDSISAATGSTAG